MSFLSSIEAWFKTPAVQEVESFFSSVVKSNVAAILPIAKQAIAGLVVAEAAQVASGNTSQTGHTLADAVKATEAAVLQAGVQATSSEILTAVAAVKA